MLVFLILTAKCLVGQLRQFKETIIEFDRKIRELLKSHPDHFLFEALSGAGKNGRRVFYLFSVPTDLAGPTPPIYRSILVSL